MKSISRVTFCSLALALLHTSAAPTQAAITDVDINSQTGTNLGGKVTGEYEDEFFCLPCDNPIKANQAFWSLEYGATVTGGAVKDFTHMLDAHASHIGNNTNSIKVLSKHGANKPPIKVTRKNSIPHGNFWDNHTAWVKPKDSDEGTFGSSWDHSSKKLAYNTTGPGGTDSALVAEYAPEAGLLALSTVGPLTISSESELFDGSYQVEFNVVLNVHDEHIEGVSSSWIDVYGMPGFDMLNGQVSFVSDVPAGDPLGEIFGELGSPTTGGSIIDTRGWTLEIVPGSFDTEFTEDTVLDALTFEFESATDLRLGEPIGEETVYFGAQFSTENADFDQDFDTDGSDFLALQRGHGKTFNEVDYAHWHQDYGEDHAHTADIASVPEPTTCLLVLISMAAMVCTRTSTCRCARGA